MKERKLRNTLNLHPALGVRAFEEQYEEMSRVLGRSTAEEDPIIFDVADRAFMDAYFDVLHRKLEKEGVDFWVSSQRESFDLDELLLTTVPALVVINAVDRFPAARLGEQSQDVGAVPLPLSRFGSR